MNTKFVPSSWLEKEGRRLDCWPYLSGALEAKLLLEKLPVPKERLRTLTSGHDGGIYNGPQFVRNYVADSAYGVPFVTSSSMLLADLTRADLLRKRDALSTRLRFLRLKPGTTLISCSGTIGRMVYARPDMDGVWSSQDILKVVPNEGKILPGYLYAFLTSRYGVPMVVGGTYGAIIQHIEPDHIAELPVPRLSQSVEQRAHDLVHEAAELRFRANQAILAAQNCVRQTLGVAPLASVTARLHQTVSSRDLTRSSRFDAFFHNPTARLIDSWLASLPVECGTLEEMADVYDVPPFKHIYVEAAYGVPFYTSGDLFGLDRKPEKYLSKTRTKDLHKYILSAGWVLLARSGQLGGIIGKPQFADSALSGAAASDHVIRIVPKTADFAGFLYAFLDLPEVGYHLLVRTASGTSIPALWPTYLKSVKVPIVPELLRREVDAQVRQAFENRVFASAKEEVARNLVEKTIRELGD